MAEILKGAPVTEALTERSKKEVEELKAKEKKKLKNLKLRALNHVSLF